MKGLLLPVIPRATEGEGQTGRPTSPAVVKRLLTTYGDKLADTVVCFEETPEMVETILETGKQVVPVIIGDESDNRCNFMYHWEEIRFKLNWIRWVISHAHEFAGVTLGNVVLEVTNHFQPDVPTWQIVAQLRNMFSSAMAHSLILAPWHYDVIRDMETANFPLQGALLRAGAWTTVYWGYELFNNPPDRIHEWLAGIPTYSGINYSTGAKQHNLRRALELGFAGCLFFLPVHPGPKDADRLMEAYLTDV